jgi:hypothetical protein
MSGGIENSITVVAVSYLVNALFASLISGDTNYGMMKSLEGIRPLAEAELPEKITLMFGWF